VVSTLINRTYEVIYRHCLGNICAAVFISDFDIGHNHDLMRIQNDDDDGDDDDHDNDIGL